MDWHKHIAELESEIGRLNQALTVARSMIAEGSGKRRGRPPAWMANTGVDPSTIPASTKAATRKRTGKRQGWTPERRKKFMESNKKRRAAAKKAAATE